MGPRRPAYVDEEGLNSAVNAKQRRRWRRKHDRERFSQVKEHMGAIHGKAGARPTEVDVKGGDEVSLNSLAREPNCRADRTKGHANGEAEDTKMHALMVIDGSGGRELLDSSLGRHDGNQ